MLASPLQNPVVTELGGIGGQSPAGSTDHCAERCRWLVTHRAWWSLCWKMQIASKRVQDDNIADRALGCDPQGCCVQNLSTTATTQAPEPAHL